MQSPNHRDPPPIPEVNQKVSANWKKHETVTNFKGETFRNYDCLPLRWKDAPLSWHSFHPQTLLETLIRKLILHYVLQYIVFFSLGSLWQFAYSRSDEVCAALWISLSLPTSGPHSWAFNSSASSPWPNMCLRDYISQRKHLCETWRRNKKLFIYLFQLFNVKVVWTVQHLILRVGL